MKPISKWSPAKVLRVMVLSAAMMAVSACGGKPEVGNAGGKMEVVSELPEPVARDESGQPLAFKLGADDLLSVKVFGSEDASVDRVRIDKSGRLSVPVAGVVNAGGLSIEELEDQLEARLRANYFRNPQVSVNLIEVESAKLTLDGQVTKPGQYPVTPNMTLIQAVASAEGTTENARLGEVVIFRTVNGQKYAALYNLSAIRSGNYADPAVFANDTIVIGDSSARRLFRDFIQIIPLLTTPVIVAFQR
jgi:polysaccharide export outer membrane protein